MRNPNIIQKSPDAIYTCDQLGFIKSYNKAAVNLWGREPVVGKDLWCGSWKIFTKKGDQLSPDQHPMAIALREGRLVHGEELIVQRPDGSIKRISPYSSPLVNDQGQLTGVVSMLMEVAELNNRDRQQEEKYKTIIDQASDAILICSFDGTIHEFNKSCYTLLGYTCEEYGRLNLKDILVEDIIVDQENYTAILAGEAKTVYRNLKHKNGYQLEVEITVKMLEDKKVIAFARDISARKKAEQALRDSEIFTKSILSSITSHIAVVKENGNIISVNKAWNDFSIENGECLLERTGVNSNYIEACERSVASGEILAARALHGFYKIIKGEQAIFEMEYPCHTKNEHRWFLMRITKFADNSPKVVMMHIDITQRVEAAAYMHDALERYDILAKATSDTIWDWDVVNNKMTYNDVITKMFGYASSEIENVMGWWKQNIHPADLEKVSATLDKVSKSRTENFQLEYRFRCEDSSYKYIFDRAFVLFGENGKPVRMIGAMQDITERKKAEAEYQAMKKELMEQKIQEQKKIARAILNAQEKERRHMGEELHDNINQMLAGTKLYLSVAGKSSEELREALQYPMRLIDETMTEIRLLTKRSATPKHNIDLQQLIQSLINAMFKKTAMKTCFVYKVADDFADDDLKLNIYRIIQEQASNIMKHAAATETVVSVTTDNRFIEIVITDNGNGFDTNKKIEGIGLSNIVNRVESFNGEVEINSTPGYGCNLLIKIPY